MKHETQAFLFSAFMAVTGMVLGSFLELSPKDAIVTGAIAMAIFLAVTLPARRDRSDEDEQGQS